MSTRSKTAAIIASAGVLVAGWQIGTANGQTVGTTSAGSGSSPSSGSTSSGTSSGTSYKDGTYTGGTVQERYGTVAVSVTISGGAITDVQAQTSVYEQRSQMFVQRALPTLRSEVIAAQNAEVNTVSGATYTSQAYLTSLQSALDQAAA